MEKVVVGIPTLNAIDWVAPLCEHLLLADRVDEVLVYDNGCTDMTREWVEHRSKIDSRLRWVDSTGVTLYNMWNNMLRRVNDESDGEPVSLAFLNSDVRLPHMAMHDMAILMRRGGYKIATVDPRLPALPSQHFGYWNPQILQAMHWFPERKAEDAPPRPPVAWAMMIAAEWWKDEPWCVDPRYLWWYGDDDIMLRTQQRGGRIARIAGLGSDHLGSSSDAHNPRKAEMIASDTALFEKMWQHGNGTYPEDTSWMG